MDPGFQRLSWRDIVNPDCIPSGCEGALITSAPTGQRASWPTAALCGSPAVQTTPSLDVDCSLPYQMQFTSVSFNYIHVCICLYIHHRFFLCVLLLQLSCVCCWTRKQLKCISSFFFCTDGSCGRIVLSFQVVQPSHSSYNREHQEVTASTQGWLDHTLMV